MCSLAPYIVVDNSGDNIADEELAVRADLTKFVPSELEENAPYRA
jgi:hypothetical protein